MSEIDAKDAIITIAGKVCEPISEEDATFRVISGVKVLPKFKRGDRVRVRPEINATYRCPGTVASDGFDVHVEFDDGNSWPIPEESLEPA